MASRALLSSVRDPNDDKSAQRFPAVVTRNLRLTPDYANEDVRHIELRISERPFSFTEGQSIGVYRTDPDNGRPSQQLRYYSIANDYRNGDGLDTSVALCVRRCVYLDPVTGVERRGATSNYLCDCRPGDTVTISGPHDHGFGLPGDSNANLVMLGIGTGIAPFRAFVKAIYRTKGRWTGKVRLFYGPREGIEMLYINDLLNDHGLHYDEETFRAMAVPSPVPPGEKPAAADRPTDQNATEVWDMLRDPKTHVYIAGERLMAQNLDDVFIAVASSKAAWRALQKKIRNEGRWAELLY